LSQGVQTVAMGVVDDFLVWTGGFCIGGTLADLPVAASRHPNNFIVFQNRYVVLIGGGFAKLVMNPDGTSRPSYGRPHRTRWGRTTFSDITVYDTHTGKFGRANPMPLCNNMPIAAIHNDRLYMLGGECEGVEFDGVHFGHHPDLLLIGDMIALPDAR